MVAVKRENALTFWDGLEGWTGVHAPSACGLQGSEIAVAYFRTHGDRELIAETPRGILEGCGRLGCCVCLRFGADGPFFDGLLLM